MDLEDIFVFDGGHAAQAPAHGDEEQPMEDSEQVAEGHGDGSLSTPADTEDDGDGGDDHPAGGSCKRKWSDAQRRQAGDRLTIARLRAKMRTDVAAQAATLAKFAHNVNRRTLTSRSELRVASKNTYGLTMVVRQHGRGSCKGRQLSLSWVAMLEVAHSKTKNCAGIARAYVVSRLTARRVIEIVAYAELEWQGFQLRVLRDIVVKSAEFGGWRLAWDEASQRVSLDAVGERTTAQQQASAWPVCVCKVEIFWGSSKDRGS